MSDDRGEEEGDRGGSIYSPETVEWEKRPIRRRRDFIPQTQPV